MRKIGVVLLLMVSVAGGWLAVQGGISTGGASAPAFDYDAADAAERTKWLNVQARPMEAMLERSLPKGNTPDDLDMRVGTIEVDARRRMIQAVINVSGKYGIDARAVPAAKASLTKSICPSYAKSDLGRNRVKMMHSFMNPNGREELSLVISPLVCREWM